MKTLLNTLSAGVLSLGLFGLTAQAASAATFMDVITQLGNNTYLGTSKSLKVTKANNACVKEGREFFVKKQKGTKPRKASFTITFPGSGAFTQDGHFSFDDSLSNPEVTIVGATREYGGKANKKSIVKKRNNAGNHVIHYRVKQRNVPSAGWTLTLDSKSVLNPNALSRFKKTTVKLTIRNKKGVKCKYTLKNKKKRARNHPIFSVN